MYSIIIIQLTIMFNIYLFLVITCHNSKLLPIIIKLNFTIKEKFRKFHFYFSKNFIRKFRFFQLQKEQKNVNLTFKKLWRVCDQKKYAERSRTDADLPSDTTEVLFQPVLLRITSCLSNYTFILQFRHQY